MAYLRLNSSKGAWLINLDHVRAVHRSAFQSGQPEQVTLFLDGPVLSDGTDEDHELQFLAAEAISVATVLALTLNTAPEAVLLHELPEIDTGGYEYDGEDDANDAEEAAP